MGQVERERTRGPRAVVIDDRVGSCGFMLSLRDALPLDEWPEDLRATALQKHREDPEFLAFLGRRERLLEFENPDDPSAGLEISVTGTGRELHRFVWQLRDSEAAGGWRTFLLGVASADVHSVRWELEDGDVYRSPTLPVPGEAARRGFVMQVAPVGSGMFEALAADGSVLESSLCTTPVGGDSGKPPELQRVLELPRVGTGELPDGGHWMLRAGMVDEDLGHWLERQPHSYGGWRVAPLLSQEEVVRVSSVHGRAEGLQVAVGQLAKHVKAVEAFDEREAPCHAERLPTVDLPVDLFVAWTLNSALHRVVALGGAGEKLGQTEIKAIP